MKFQDLIDKGILVKSDEEHKVQSDGTIHEMYETPEHVIINGGEVVETMFIHIEGDDRTLFLEHSDHDLPIYNFDSELDHVLIFHIRDNVNQKE